VQPENAGPAVLGRSAELIAAAMVAEAAVGDGGLLLLTGEAGIGKTTVLHAVASGARRRGLAVHVAGTPADPDRAALSPWVQLFEEYLRGLGAEAVRRIVGPGASALSLLGRLQRGARRRHHPSQPDPASASLNAISRGHPGTGGGHGDGCFPAAAASCPAAGPPAWPFGIMLPPLAFKVVKSYALVD
jgi:hypothetical protein